MSEREVKQRFCGEMRWGFDAFEMFFPFEEESDARLAAATWTDEYLLSIGGLAIASLPEAKIELTFAQFQRRNIARSRSAFSTCDDWSLNDWAVALAGEVGELCNLLKKNRRASALDERFALDGPYFELARQAVIDELADVIIYADLMLSLLQASTEQAVAAKFAEVSRRVGYVEEVR